MEGKIHSFKWPFSPLAAHWTHQGSSKNHGSPATAQASQNSGARSQAQQYRGLTKQKISLLSSCPKLSEFRKEHTIIVSAIFYFGAGRPKIMDRRGDSGVPFRPYLLQEFRRFLVCLPLKEHFRIQNGSFSFMF